MVFQIFIISCHLRSQVVLRTDLIIISFFLEQDLCNSICWCSAKHLFTSFSLETKLSVLAGYIVFYNKKSSGKKKPRSRRLHSWVFFGRTDAEAETPILWPPHAKSWLIRPWCWEGLGAGGEGEDRGWDGWMASPTQRTWVWVNSGSWWSIRCCSPWDHKE